MKRKWSHLFALGILFGFAASGLWAKEKSKTVDEEDEPVAVSVSDIQGLSDRITDLAKYAKVGLMLQVQYVNSGFNPVGPKGFNSPIKASSVTGEPINDLFLGRRAEIALFGDVEPKRISYLLKYDPLGTTTVKAGVSSGEQLKDFFTKVSYVPYADILFGQAKYPQGLEGRQPTGELDFVNRAVVVSALNDRRDLTFQVSGTRIPVGIVNLDYALAIVQGSGQNTPDNNDNKDWAGRIGLDVADTGLWIGVSGYTGWESSVPAYSGGRNFTGLEARWTWNGLKIQGEYIQGQFEPGNNFNPWAGTSVATAKESNPEGWYASVNYRWQDWRLGMRVESYDPDTTAGSKYNVNSDTLTAGVDWFQSKDRFRLYADFEKHFGQYDTVLTQAEINL